MATKKTNKRKTATETREEYNLKVNDLALSTYKWAQDQDCKRDKEDGSIHGYFVIEKRAKAKVAKPIWTEFTGEDREIWPDVLMRMLQLGFPICADAFQGHYIGVDGEQGVKIGTQINNIFTRAESARQMAQFIIESRMWNLAAPYITKKLPDPLKETDALQLLQALDQLFLGAGIPVQMSIAQYLLAASAGEDDAA